MKFTVQHKRYGYFGMSDTVTYEDEPEKAALFTKDSAEKLLVDIYDPRVIITEYTDEEIAQLPYTLVDTEEILKERSVAHNRELLEQHENAVEAFTEFADVIDDLNEVSELDLSGLEVPSEIQH